MWPFFRGKKKRQKHCGRKVTQWESALELVRAPNTQTHHEGMCECLFPFTKMGGILACCSRNSGLFSFRNWVSAAFGAELVAPLLSAHCPLSVSSPLITGLHIPHHSPYSASGRKTTKGHARNEGNDTDSFSRTNKQRGKIWLGT